MKRLPQGQDDDELESFPEDHSRECRESESTIAEAEDIT